MAEWKSIIFKEKFIKKSGEELLRLKQISGLASLFADKEFSEAWK